MWFLFEAKNDWKMLGVGSRGAVWLKAAYSPTLGWYHTSVVPFDVKGGDTSYKVWNEPYKEISKGEAIMIMFEGSE